MEVLQYMTPEGLERILLLDGAVVRPEDLLSAPASASSTNEDSKHPQCLLQSSTLRVVPVNSAKAKRK